MKKMSAFKFVANRISYGFMLGIFFLLALLPLRILYVLSDFFYLLIYFIFKYRRDVVEENFQIAFPKLSSEERKKQVKLFYRHFCDYFIETIKLLHVSDRQMRKRFRFENAESLDHLVDEKKSAVLLLGHYGNWEWVTSIPLSVNPKIKLGQIYQRLSSPSFDKLMYRIRSRFSVKSIEKRETLRNIIEMKKLNQSLLLGFIADQRPSHDSARREVSFFDRPTWFLTGVEKIINKFDMEVFYLDIKLIKRGHYVGEIIPLPKQSVSDEQSYAETYASLLEKSIKNNPSLWLWSHKRWLAI